MNNLLFVKGCVYTNTHTRASLNSCIKMKVKRDYPELQTK